MQRVIRLRPGHNPLRSRPARQFQASPNPSMFTSPLGPGPGPGPGLEGHVAAHAELVNRFKQFVPTLSGSNYKGQHGKIGVVGGCREYTGAPYFAAISATKVGADMTYVFCTESAGLTIKSYSPELIVMPILPESPLFEDPQPPEVWRARVDWSVSRSKPWIERLSALVVGPGLGDDPQACAAALQMIRLAREAGVPLIVDGSGISLIVQHLDLIKGYKRCILTPNIAELGRLAAAVGVEAQGPMGSQWQVHTQDIAKRLGGPLVVSKGPVDVVTDGGSSLMCSVHATPKRSGGQGDVLAGVMSVFASWVCRKGACDSSGEPRALAAAAYTACSVMRDASLRAFGRKERAMVAGDIIEEVHAAFKKCLVT